MQTDHSYWLHGEKLTDSQTTAWKAVMQWTSSLRCSRTKPRYSPGFSSAATQAMNFMNWEEITTTENIWKCKIKNNRILVACGGRRKLVRNWATTLKGFSIRRSPVTRNCCSLRSGNKKKLSRNCFQTTDTGIPWRWSKSRLTFLSEPFSVLICGDFGISIKVYTAQKDSCWFSW